MPMMRGRYSGNISRRKKSVGHILWKKRVANKLYIAIWIIISIPTVWNLLTFVNQSLLDNESLQEMAIVAGINTSNRTAAAVPSPNNVVPGRISSHFITYANDRYARAKNRLINEANNSQWFETYTAYGPEDLPVSFVKTYKDVLALSRGGGYWIWKYTIIRKTLATMKEGDILVYLDAGCSINPLAQTRFDDYVTMLTASPVFDIISFQGGRQMMEHVWTTESVFQYFNVEASNSTVRMSGQYYGGALILQNGPHLRKWMAIVEQALRDDRWLFTDKYNKEAKRHDAKFRENRHDQSVSSVSRKIVGSIVIPQELVPSNSKQFPFWASRKNR